MCIYDMKHTRTYMVACSSIWDGNVWSFMLSLGSRDPIKNPREIERGLDCKQTYHRIETRICLTKRHQIEATITMVWAYNEIFLQNDNGNLTLWQNVCHYKPRHPRNV